MSSFFTPEELALIGFKCLGKNVLVSRKASIYSSENIEIGNNVRIDDFCILSGVIKIASNIHIAAYCALYGRNGIELLDFSGLSPRVTVFSAMDDFSGEYLVGPMVSSIYTNVSGGKVTVKKFAQIGMGSVIFPNVILGEGSTVGAMSLVKNTVEDWTIVAGIPAKKIKMRSKKLLDKALAVQKENL